MAMPANDLILDLAIRYGFQVLGAIVILCVGFVLAWWIGSVVERPLRGMALAPPRLRLWPPPAAPPAHRAGRESRRPAVRARHLPRQVRLPDRPAGRRDRSGWARHRAPAAGRALQKVRPA